MAQQASYKGNTIQDYVTVAERIEKFYAKHPEGRLVTQIIEHDVERGFILMRAEVYRNPDDAQPSATGHAYEYRDAGYVQKTSYIEVCETSACGRALALCGFEVKRGIASREEMDKQARMSQSIRDKAVTAAKEVATLVEKPDRPAAPAPPVAAKPAPARAERPVSETQKEEILNLLEAAKPNDRPAQRALLVDLTGRQSREELTYQEATSLITKLKAEVGPDEVQDDPLM